MPTKALAPIAHNSPRAEDTCALSLKWCYQLLLELGGHRTFISRHGLNDDDLAVELGLGKWLDADEASPVQLRRALRGAARQFDVDHPCLTYPDRLAANLMALGELLALNETELQVLGFCVLMCSDPILNDTTDQLGMLGFNRAVRVLSVLLGLPQPRIEACLSNDSALVRSGLLEVSTSARASMVLTAIISVANPELPGLLRHSQGTALELFSYAFRLSPSGNLAHEHYSHLRQPLTIAERYLNKALINKRRGVNILLYGPPGTGKTHLSRLLAASLRTPLYEVACTDSDGDPVSSKQRLCSLRAANSVLGAQRAMLVMDEIEDVFQSTRHDPQGRAQKAWINRMLEENPLPCFWLSNSIEAIDAAHVRRFDLVIEVPNPPLAQRKRMLRECGSGKLSEDLITQLSANEQVTPAVLERAVRVGRSVSQRAGKSLDNAIRCIVDGTLKAQGFDRLESANSDLPAFYSPQWVNTDQSLATLTEGLRSHPQARLCFYGPPGTGKTAFGRWLAQALGKPLLAKRVSDLVSPYVGMTEQNLAGAFEQAQQQDAVLLLDEVDSFLQDRRKARQSWEITAVNEMLTQMESYRGLFIASTNLIADLDQASLRRFDLKVYFGYLSAQQAQSLFATHLKGLNLKDPQQTAASRLRGEAHLTPGDFAAVTRQARFKPFATANELATALLAECRLKPAAQQRPIGFIH
ncbi:ATPase central domain-containing protein [Pseudomonas sp. StFLB209]|uniref:AAA family ATPase n=1 Tax=Pseudomonas sp. StFLB209 TaxID=1028989 RepID=UPI0004F62CEC|nr:ATP-binding protein [Pseudomonas sp. StFLB209]BAP41548.1 ATPase central domain-containing protein [Pseudomonas sp. StFLB209]